MQLLLFFERPKVALLAREIFGKNIIITEHTCICIFIIERKNLKNLKKQLHSWAKVGILATGCRQRIRKMAKTIQISKENFAQASVVIKVAGSIESFSMYTIWYIIKTKFLIVQLSIH